MPTAVASRPFDTLILPPPRFAALVFDMDGTLVDNMRVHAEAWQEFGRRRGWDVTTPEFLAATGHGTIRDVLSRLLGREPSPAEYRDLGEAKEALYREMYAPHVRPVAGLGALLSAAAGRGVRIAMCTNADRANVDFIVEALGLRGVFEAFVIGTDVARGKPDPEGYRLAAERLGLPAEECCAFEDSPQGVRSARSAGMSAVGITTHLAAGVLAEAGAHQVVPDYREERLIAWLGLGE